MIARECAASFLGFVFVPGVRRQLSVDQVARIVTEYRRICGSGGPFLVGLFANQSVEFVNAAIEGCGLDFAQLCGDEPADYYEKISARVIKQIKIPNEGDFQNIVSDTMQEVDSILGSGSIPLLDRLDRGHLGGTGKSFDWNIAASLPKDWEFILAGGLNPINVSEAIELTRPWTVDVSTGVETLGLKDPSKIRAFSEAVLKS
ncbi:uncharacterized protein METZ01_LOCUS322911 [marine metagenome]|uniref:phosphoribosylanthranilate isomerase n=1 Tax=marine metagenome TaxID=408172 RepID=A0A382PB38_9ZZZZ